MDNDKKNFINSFKDELSRLISISFGVFLFILFFQPFPLEMLDYNNRLLFVTGFWLISFILTCIVFILLPITVPKWFKISEWESGPPFILNFLFLALTSTAFVFYIRYVGRVPLSFYIIFKVVLVCLFPLIILIILYKNKSLEQYITILKEQNKLFFSKIQEYEKIGEDEEIIILSENKSDKLILKYKNIIAIKSADNYIEIYYLENDVVEKKLIRNTLKNIEHQLINHRNFIRCHRTTIINTIYIYKLLRSYSGYSLKMNYLEEKMPVSRQYLIQVKDSVSTNE